MTLMFNPTFYSFKAFSVLFSQEDEALERFSSVQSLSRVHSCDPMDCRPPCPSLTPGVYPNSCALNWWCHPTISSSVVPFSSHLQSFPAPGSFPMSQLFSSGGQGTGASASASVLPMNIQDWSPLGWTGWISLQSFGLSRVFSKDYPHIILPSIYEFSAPDSSFNFHIFFSNSNTWTTVIMILGKMINVATEFTYYSA